MLNETTSIYFIISLAGAKGEPGGSNNAPQQCMSANIDLYYSSYICYSLILQASPSCEIS